MNPTSAVNTYEALTHKQVFHDGVQDEFRDNTFATQICEVDNTNAEYIYERFGEDVPADKAVNDTYSAKAFEYEIESAGITDTSVKAEYISMDEVVKQGFMIKADRISRHAEAHARKLNRDTANHMASTAGQTLTDGDLVTATNSGGSNPLIMGQAMADDLASTIEMKLQQANRWGEGLPFIHLRPKDARALNLFALNSGNNVQDNIITKGFKFYKNMLGLNILISNDAPIEVTGTASTNFTANGTVSVGGVTFTFKAVPAAAGEVDLGADLATSLTNLAAAINNTNNYATGAGSATAYFEVSAANREILQNYNIEATATATTLAITGNSSTTIAVAEGEGTGDFAWGTVRSIILAGLEKSALIRLPSAGFETKTLDQIDGFLGIQVRSAQKYGHKTWTKKANSLVRIPVVA